VTIEPWRNVPVPQVFVPGLNHGTILREPSPALVDMVVSALDVSSGSEYEQWTRAHRPASDAALRDAGTKRWQQFIVHATDERGDGISDYFVELGTIVNRRFKRIEAFDADVHAYREDESYRNFHVNLDKLRGNTLETLAVRIIASSGTELVGYQGFNSKTDLVIAPREANKWDAILQFDARIGSREVQFIHPYTTTLVEIRLNREPMPLVGVNRVFWFLREP
jgi:hypothetical protein